MAEENKADVKMDEETNKQEVKSDIDLIREAAGESAEDMPAPEPVVQEKKPEKKAEKKPKKAEKIETKEAPAEPSADGPKIFALRTTANREDQVMDFLSSNINKKGLAVYSVIRPHGMRGYIFIEAGSKQDAEQAAQGIPYARGILPKEIDYSEMEHMVEPVKRELTIKKNDIVEIISGPFKRETAKITRIDEQKEEVVVELVEAAVPIPITLKIDAVKVIRRDTDDHED
ncbi:transcription elongation factor Spt5 [Candidatus Woesearchaeota archaeon]|nr:transcription elongation factor Spt5 [Candidatus Woesearchaeota archaeon]